MRKYDGICDKCGQLSGPHVIDGQWMCPDCTQALVDQLRARVEELEAEKKFKRNCRDCKYCLVPGVYACPGTADGTTCFVLKDPRLIEPPKEQAK